MLRGKPLHETEEVVMQKGGFEPASFLLPRRCLFGRPSSQAQRIKNGSSPPLLHDSIFFRLLGRKMGVDNLHSTGVCRGWVYGGKETMATQGYVRRFSRLCKDWSWGSKDGRDLHPSLQQHGKRVLFFGDSDFTHWVDEDMFHSSMGVCVAVSGARLSDMSTVAVEVLERYQPDVVFAVGGENDIAEAGVLSDPTPQLEADLSSILSACAARGIPFVHFGCKHEPATRELWDAYDRYDAAARRILRGALEEEAAAEAAEAELAECAVKGYAVCGGGAVPTVFVDSSDLQGKRFFSTDDLHLGRDGYRVWNSKVRAIMVDVLGVPL